MGIHSEYYPDKSVITIDNNHFIGVENKIFQSLVQNRLIKEVKISQLTYLK